MRRRRQALQVSTFPFLAVLLCAMGALILLLLVIDRRAKLAARERATQAQQQLAAERAQEREQKQAELRRQRQEREEAARREAQQIAEQAEAARQKAESVRVNLDKEESRYRDLQRQMAALRGRLAQTEQEVVAVETEADKANAAEDVSRQERRRLTEQLAQLEAVLAGLKELREREKRTYSLVPYYGKRGQGRKPIYVECQGEAVIFHPDVRELTGLELSEPAIRREVEERIARQRSGPDPPARGEAPYLFLLVRPEGVATYYLVQNALQGTKVDFGYEFVDADWVLDFSGRGDARSPWKKVAGPMKLEPNRPSPPVAVRFGQASFGARSGGMPSGGGGGRAPEFIFPGMELYLMDKAGVRGGSGVRGVGPFAEAGAAPAPGSRAASGGIGSARAMNSSSGYPEGSPGGTVSGIPVGGPSPAGILGGNGAPGGVGPARAMKSFPDAPGASPQGMEPGGPAGVPSPSGIASGSAAPGGSGQGTPGVPPPNLPGDLQGQAVSVAQGGGGPPVPGAPSPEKQAPQSQEGTLNLAPISPGGAVGGQPGGSGQIAGIPGKGGPAGEPSDIPSTPLLAPPSLPGAARGTKATDANPPLPRTRILNRDWVIPIECQGDGILLIPGRVRFSTAALTPTPGTVHPLALAVQQLIVRRQATVTAGDPPYRPRLLFQVRTEGLRAYYLAYPLLEVLRLPMARENVSARAAPSNRPTIFGP